jgi:hypothetical protein
MSIQCRLLDAYFEKGTLTINLCNPIADIFANSHPRVFLRTGTLPVPRRFLSIESVYSNYHFQSHYRRTLPVSMATLRQSSPSNPKFTLSVPFRSQFCSSLSKAVFPSNGVFSADTSCSHLICNLPSLPYPLLPDEPLRYRTHSLYKESSR